MFRMHGCATDLAGYVTGCRLRTRMPVNRSVMQPANQGWLRLIERTRTYLGATFLYAATGRITL